jgi:two-component system, LytTR family, sensor kinase
MTEIRTQARSARWIWIAAIWCAGALFEASQTLLTMHAVGVGKAWLRPFLIVFASWLPWALATPYVIKLARRWPIVRGQIIRAMSLHLVAFAAISVTAEGWSALLRVIFNPWHRSSPPTFVNTWSDLLVEQLMTFVIAYAPILTVTYAVDSREKTVRLNDELSRAQLAALRGQMDPHFMFNTLNSIAGLVYKQRGDAAIGMIVGLSEFLRRALEESHRAQVTLQKEVEYLQRYLDIQDVRFGDRLRVSVDILDELLATQVPNLLLQPLVENAIKHGVSKCPSGGDVFRMTEEQLSLAASKIGQGVSIHHAHWHRLV